MTSRFNPREPGQAWLLHELRLRLHRRPRGPSGRLVEMEFNYRYVNAKAPLEFSVVNVGCVRKFLLELSASRLHACCGISRTMTGSLSH